MATTRKSDTFRSSGKRVKWSRGTRRFGRRLLRIGLVLVAVLLSLATGGALYQEVASRSDRAEFPPPGEMIEIGDHRIHLLDAGTEHDGPTVVLFAGAGSMSAQWAWVQPEVATFARVVSYDRAGLGWSDSSNDPKDARTAAKELYRVLNTAGVPGPYVLVGHSLGGSQARVFADLYRDQVAGMVLIDQASPEFWTSVDSDGLEETRDAISQARLFPLLARFGILRIMDPIGEAAEHLPNQQRDVTRAMFASTRHAETTRDDYRELLETSRTMEHLRNVTPIQDLPLIVLSRTEPDDAFTGPQQEIDAALAATSVHGSHRLVEGADHVSIVTSEEHARETTDAIREILDTLTAP